MKFNFSKNIIAFLIGVAFHFNASAQLNGTYTINSAIPTGGTNYQTFAAALNALGTLGVNGPVVFNVAVGSGPYIETFYLGAIPGASTVNTVRFNGNGNTIQFAATTTDPHIVRLIGTKYLTLNDLVIKTTSIYGWAVSLSAGAELDSIINCTIDLTASTNTSSAYCNGITLTGLHTGITSTGTGARKCYIGKNQLLGNTTTTGSMYHGIRINTGSDSNIVEGNLIANFSNYGIYISSTPGTLVLDNEIHRATKTTTTIGYGMYIINSSPGTYILSNRIHSLGGANGTGTSTTYGMHFATGHGSVAAPNIIANNVLYNFNQNGINYGISSSSTYRVRFYHNTIVMNVPLSTTSTTYGIYANGTQLETEYKNNIVSITAGSTGIKYGYYFVNNTGVIAGGLQRNNIYVNSTQPGTQYHSYFAGVNYPTLAAFQAANPGMEIGSLSINPDFQNMPADFIPGPSAAALATNGVPLTAQVPLDFNKNARNIDPTPGAYEMNVDVNDDAGADSLYAPKYFCPGKYPVTVSIRNFGDNEINTVQVHWELNGVPQTSVTFNGVLTTEALNPATSVAMVNLGLGNFIAGTNTIKWWTSMPNNNPDPRNINDTAIATFDSKETPIVNLGPDRILCVDEGHLEFVDARNFGADYLWDNNYNGMVRVVDKSGTYWVKVTNEFGCSATDTINITFKPNPKVDLGKDTVVCNGVILNIDAGSDGIQYYWNTGQTTQNIKVNNPGTYSVQVTGQNGCVKSDSITINMQGQLPTSGGIMVNNLGPFTFSFSCINPLNIIGYQWSFGDGNYSSTPNPTHTYSNIGNYVVTLNLASVCGYGADTVTTHIFTKINENEFDVNDLQLYPNPAKERVTIKTTDGLWIQNVRVLSVLGAAVSVNNSLNANEYTIELNAYANGMYQIEVTTNKGVITKKLEVLK